MKLLHHTWRVSLWCTRKTCLLALWLGWFLLVAIALVQIQVLRTHELSLPAPVRQRIERQLAENGFNCTFARSTLDISGLLRLEKVAFRPTSVSSPLITARSAYVKLAPWALILGRLHVEKVGASGLDLHLPAPLSPTGEDEILAGDIDFALQTGAPQLQLDHFTARIGPLLITASGTIHLPEAKPTHSPSDLIDELVARYLSSGRKVPALIAQLSALENPTLALDFVPAGGLNSTLHATLRADSLDLSNPSSQLSALPSASAQGLSLSNGSSKFVTGPLTLGIEIPLTGYPLLVTGDGQLASLTVPAQGSAQDLRFHLLGLLPAAHEAFLPESIALQFASAHWHDFVVGPSHATVLPQPDDWLDADISTTLAGSPWQIKTRLDPHHGAGRVQIDGHVDDALLGMLSAIAKHDLAELLSPTSPAPLHAVATFLPGWKFQQATGTLHSGPVRVGKVHLDETGTEFIYRPGSVLCDDLVLRQGDSLAHGLYEMNTSNMDFRFLLTGGLRPDGIAGWFEGWWTHFWSSFDFSKAVPIADVDVAGRWGDIHATRVFVQADGTSTGLNGQRFDHVNTRVFVRPQWNDILSFSVTQQRHKASGSFTRLFDLEKDTWSHMRFAVHSGLPLDTIRGILGPESIEVLAPYRFTEAPQFTLSGHAESHVSPGGAHEAIDIDLTSKGAAAFHDFPISDLVFTAHLRDAEIALPALAFTAAGGRVVGTARVWGTTDENRQVAFDAKLTGASLADAIKILSVATKPESADKTKSDDSSLHKQLTHGRLDLVLKAQGPYQNFHAFEGTGQAKITDADLGEINLFGLLSKLLKKTIFDFSSFSLTKLDAQFAIQGSLLNFESVKISGPSAAVLAVGDYDLKNDKLAFKAQVSPFNESKSVVGSTVGFVLTPISKVLEVKLQGTLANPDWTFIYGPTNFLRTLIGAP